MTTPLRWLFLIQLISMGSMEMSAPFWAQHLQHVESMSEATLAWVSGMAYAGPMLMTMLCSPFWGKVGDLTGHKLMLIRALSALTITQFWIAFSDDVASILIARLLQGALAGFIATSQAYGSGLVNKEQRGTLMAHLQMATALGSILGPMIGGYLYSRFGFNQVNVIAAILCACATITTIWCLPLVRLEKKAAERTTGVGVISPFVGILLAIALIQSAKMMPQVFFAIYVEKMLNAPAWLTGVCYGATALGLCLAAPIWARRFAQKTCDAILCEIECCCWICALLLGITSYATDIWLFVFSRIIWGILLAALLPVLYTILSRTTSDTQQGLVLGLGNSAAKAGALFGILIGSLGLAYLPLTQLFWLVSGSYILCALGIRYQRLASWMPSSLNP